jgi:hypothetical protein
MQTKLKDKIGLGNTFVELVDSDIFLCGFIPEGNLISLRKLFFAYILVLTDNLQHLH